MKTQIIKLALSLIENLIIKKIKDPIVLSSVIFLYEILQNIIIMLLEGKESEIAIFLNSKLKKINEINDTNIN